MDENERLRNEIRELQVGNRIRGDEIAELQRERVAMVAEIERLNGAIRKHRDQRGDDRCWVDDVELYAAIGEERTDSVLPPKCEFLKSCERFWEQRQLAGEKVIAEATGMTIGDLEREIERLRAELKTKEHLVNERGVYMKLYHECDQKCVGLRAELDQAMVASTKLSDQRDQALACLREAKAELARLKSPMPRASGVMPSGDPCVVCGGPAAMMFYDVGTARSRNYCQAHAERWMQGEGGG